MESRSNVCPLASLLLFTNVHKYNIIFENTIDNVPAIA